MSKVIVSFAEDVTLAEDLKDLIKDELNVEAIEFNKDSTDFVAFELKPQLKTLGPKYGKRLNEIREFLSTCDSSSVVKTLKDGGKVEFNGIELGLDDVLITVKNKEGFVSESDGNITVVLDVVLTEELKQKGLVREFVSNIQQTRKDIGLEVTDHIVIEVCGDQTLTDVLMNFVSEIKSGTLCDKVELKPADAFNFNFEGKEIKFNIKKA